MEQRTGPRETDVLAIERRPRPKPQADLNGGVAVQERPAASIVRRSDRSFYAGRGSRIVVRHHLGRIIAVIEIVSPGNKDSRHALREFVEKMADFLSQGVRVMVIDLFPPTPRDPYGIHKAIWDELLEEDFAFPQGKNRIVALYQTAGEYAAYVEPVAVGEFLPEMPLFLTNELHVLTPLEPTYQAAWAASPEGIRTAVETGVMPDPEAE